MSLFVIYPTEDPDVHMAYQVADEKAAEELARELILKNGKRAVLARPYAVAVPEVHVRKMVNGPNSTAVVKTR